MNPVDATHHITPDVRAAIGAFLNECQKDSRPFAISEALGAIRHVFPDLQISDGVLLDAITSEASTAGFDIDYDVSAKIATLKRQALKEWDNEGGAIGNLRSPRRSDG